MRPGADSPEASRSSEKIRRGNVPLWNNLDADVKTREVGERILMIIRDDPKVTIDASSSKLNLSRPTITNHTKILKRPTSEKDGRNKRSLGNTLTGNAVSPGMQHSICKKQGRLVK